MREWASEPETPADRHRRMPPGSRPGTTRVPFPVIDRAQYLAEVERYGKVAPRTHGAPVALVNLADLHAIQDDVNDERIGQHLENPLMYAPGTRASGHGGLIDKPVVVKLGGRLILHDGHHRATSAHLRGQQTMKVRLVDLDAEGEGR